MIQDFLLFYFFILLRYIVIAGGAYGLFYKLLTSKFIAKKIQHKFPDVGDYRREIRQSLLTFIFFALNAVFIIDTPFKQYTQIYDHITDYGWAYFLFSIVLSIIVHDTYFYWLHRLMHHPKLFRYMHKEHHKSLNPTPFASFSFSWAEAIIESNIITLLVLLFPIHPIALIIFLIIITFINVYGHLGFEIMPKYIIQSPIGNWINTSLYHNMHHQHFNGNYGLYFRFWDKLMKTERLDYQSKIEEMCK